MASDVEVLRKLLEAFATGYFSGNAWVVEAPIREGAYPASDPARDTKAALSSAISVLEARETQRCQQPSRILPGRACLNVLPCKTHGMEAQPKVEGRASEESMRIARGYAADVCDELRGGVGAPGEEPEDHRALRLIESEAVRARASEAALSERVARMAGVVACVHALGKVVAEFPNFPAAWDEYLSALWTAEEKLNALSPPSKPEMP